MDRAAKANQGLKSGHEPSPQRNGRPRDPSSVLQDRLGNRGVLALLQAKPAPSTAGTPAVREVVGRGLSGAGGPLPHRERIQASFGRHDVSGVEAHTGGAAREANAALGAYAYTSGRTVAFDGAPSLHTAAHEAAHVIQQRAGVHLKGGFGEAGDAHERHADAVAERVVRGESAESLLDQYKSKGEGAGGGVQFHLRMSSAVATAGNFEINMTTVPAAAPGGAGGLDGWIQFTPTAGAPNSNTIGFWQIAKVTNAGRPGSDVRTAPVTPLAMPRGALGRPGLHTEDNAATGVTGGYYMEVYHTTHTPGVAMSPRIPVEPTPAGGTAGFGAQAGPAGGRYGTGGVFGLTPSGSTPGFKRSDDPSDIKSTALYDVPGAAIDLDYEFESVARGEDTGINYGTVSWGFGTRSGAVVSEHAAITAGSTATFAETVERMRDFYAHEPVTIYFEFDHDNVTAAEDTKITGLAGYLTRNPAVQMTLEGFADQVGNVTYNVGLSQRRVESVRRSIVGHFPTAHVAASTVVPGGGHGRSTAATDATSEQPAGTSDQPGAVAATGADQSREANRQFNRRVVITFSHPAGTGPTAPGGVAAPPAAAPGP